MTEKEMLRNQKWSLGYIRHAKEVKKMWRRPVVTLVFLRKRGNIV